MPEISDVSDLPATERREVERLALSEAYRRAYTTRVLALRAAFEQVRRDYLRRLAGQRQRQQQEADSLF